MDSKFVAGVRVDKVTWNEALEKAREFLRSASQHKIFTPNPEMVVKAQKDEYFRKILNAGDLNLCDGFGLSFFSGAPRITGVDFMIALCKLAAEQGRSVYLLGSGSDEVAKKTAEELQKKFPGFKIAGFDKGPDILENRKQKTENSSLPINQLTMDIKENENVIKKINDSHPNILFVAFGMGKQEKWINENLAKMSSVKIAMVVGGAFDYISGSIKRAPLFLRKIGLEWLYRLVKQPKRFFRIINATLIFMYIFLRNSLKHENIKT